VEDEDLYKGFLPGGEHERGGEGDDGEGGVVDPLLLCPDHSLLKLSFAHAGIFSNY
jgi:hypothetical protein